MHHPSDDDLIKALKTDRDRAFKSLYERYASVLLRYAYRFVGNQPQAEEVLHDVFTELLKDTLPGFTHDGLKPWLFTITKNKCLNVAKKSKRELSDLQPELSQSQTPEDELDAKQFNQRFTQCETQLPQDLQDTWALRKQGHDYQQIADTLAIPIGTVKSRFNRLTQLLRKELGYELE